MALGQGMIVSGEKVYLESPSLRLEYDLGSGRVGLWALPSRPVLLNATVGVIFPRGMTLAADPHYTRHSHLASSADPSLAGEQLVVSCQDMQRRLDLECRMTLLRDRPGAVCEVLLSNVSDQDMIVCAAEPLRALLDEHAGCFFGAERVYSRVHRVLRNGYLYSDPGEIIDTAWQGRRDVTSFWNAAFYTPASQETLVVGYLENRQAEGQIIATWDMSRIWQHGLPAFDLTARSLYHRTFVLPPGGRVSSGRCLVLLSADPFSGLEYYAETYGRLHNVRLNPIINGWCSWFYTHTQATEDEQLQNAAFIARHLKPYGMEWVQIDDGYQQTFGDWEGNHLYPHGMRWLAAEIRKLGLKPGIWIAPYAVSEPASLVQQHPEWLAHDAAGALQETASTRAKYILDITHPGAQRWLQHWFETIAQVWGYDFIKIDFVEWTILAIARYYDPHLSRAQAYRLGFDIMRTALGPHRHLLDCGPGPATVGLLDSMRIEQDLPRNTWEQYTKHSSSTGPAMAKRYYFHRRTWINDADHIGLGLLTIPQAQAVASLIALSGGMMISGDCLYTLDTARLDILKKVLPTYGEAARPLDLFDKGFPEIFALRLIKDFGQWWLVGYFNWDEEAEAHRAFDLARLGLDTQKPYLVYTFWEQRLLADSSDKVPLCLAPSSVHLLAIHEKRGVPQLLSTDRHYTQGALELADVCWDAAQQTLSGTALGAPGLGWTLTIYVPEGFVWDASRHHSQHGCPGVAAVAYESNLLRARLDFVDTDRVPWSFTFTTMA
jgi:hypothetical protein